MSVLEPWPELPLESWQDTYATLHMWTQIVGKIRKTLTPQLNHWWNVTLYVTARGLTTSPMYYGTRVVDIDTGTTSRHGRRRFGAWRADAAS